MIKFRAWDKKDKVVREVTAIEWSLEYVEFMRGAVERDFEDLILMQSTGLKDKNGVEIFEGDVFESEYARYVVFWQKDAARFVLKFIHDFEDSYYLDMRNVESMDLIGNIHENPELLSSGIE